ncbi:Ppx/GppA family phosphatase [Thioclava litoralis]|uniref:Ppx/GppA family phosphatase n=1 Tax=Thioclava litoralis TaxID=3076557 RepID=A0ABZ1E0U9_9RHOB|nr:Ppx/GppA family phosphatase [Thioclava sp. FTW29]
MADMVAVGSSTDNDEWDPFGKPLFDDPSIRALSRVGVVDIGSNSIRMVVFDGAARSPAYFFNEKVMAGLGQGLAETGRLNPEGRIRALTAMRRFAALAKGMKVNSLTCVATAAMRDAEDGPNFHKLIEQETGLTIHVVDGPEEARLSAQGVLLGWPDANGLICDIGGNSMELAEVRDGKVWRRVSSQLGPFRLQLVGDRAAQIAHVKETMQRLAAEVGTDYERIYLVGGSWRAIARIDMEREAYPLLVLHEYRMTPEAVGKTLEMIESTNLSDLRTRTGIGSARMDLVPYAAIVLRELVALFQPAEIDVSSYGIREGLLYEQMPDRLRRRDPLIEACRHAERRAARLPGFGKKMHSFIQPIWGEVPPETYRLIRAACLLHDTTWRTHPDYRADACFENVTRANMAALSHPERILVGLALLHRYKNNRSNSAHQALFKLLSKDQIREAEILGKAMRFAAMFSIDDPTEAGVLTHHREDKRLELSLTRKGADLFGEVTESRFTSLCNSLGVKPVIRQPA